MLDPEKAAEDMYEEIVKHEAMDPREATRAQSIEFLEVIVSMLKTNIDTMKAEQRAEGE